MSGATTTLRAALACVSVLLCGALASEVARAEPWLAVRSGLACVNCHVNPAGGGQRNAFGNSYAQTVLSGRFVTADDASEPWTGAINRWLSVGGDFRGRLAGTHLSGEEDPPTEFDIQDVFAYFTVDLVPDRLLLHVDERLGPRGASNRQAFALLRPGGGSWYLKAGRFVLPFGWRLEDDSAFIRQVPGISFTTPDTGIAGGFDRGAWSAQLALSNGTAGAPEIDDGKQLSLLASYAARRWRVGASFNHNDADVGDRSMAGVFAGLLTGPIAWLAEFDVVRDDSFTEGRREFRVALLEGNYSFGRGHNLKFTFEHFDPDDDAQANRRRSSLVWEYFPMQFLHGRVGVRSYSGSRGVALQNRDEWFAQLHVYF
jgi:hypothetical protein